MGQVRCRANFRTAVDGYVVRKGKDYMELKCFPYTTTNRLVKYSKLVTKAIASFNRNNASTLGTIAYDPSYGIPPNEDLLKYWDKWNEDITIGRYLLFKIKDGREIPFWTGINSTTAKTIFIIWFEINNLPTDYKQRFEEFEEFKPKSGKGNEVWIQMKDAVFEKFCNSLCILQKENT